MLTLSKSTKVRANVLEARELLPNSAKIIKARIREVYLFVFSDGIDVIGTAGADLPNTDTNHNSR